MCTTTPDKGTGMMMIVMMKVFSQIVAFNWNIYVRFYQRMFSLFIPQAVVGIQIILNIVFGM